MSKANKSYGTKSYAAKSYEYKKPLNEVKDGLKFGDAESIEGSPDRFNPDRFNPDRPVYNKLAGVDNPTKYSPALKKAIAQAKEAQKRLSVCDTAKGLPVHLCRVAIDLHKDKRLSKKATNVVRADKHTLQAVYGGSDCPACKEKLYAILATRKHEAKTYRVLKLKNYPPMEELVGDIFTEISLSSLCCLASWEQLALYYSQPKAIKLPEPLMTKNVAYLKQQERTAYAKKKAEAVRKL